MSVNRQTVEIWRTSSSFSLEICTLTYHCPCPIINYYAHHLSKKLLLFNIKMNHPLYSVSFFPRWLASSKSAFITHWCEVKPLLLYTARSLVLEIEQDLWIREVTLIFSCSADADIWMHKESLQRRSMQKQKTWGRGQIIKFEAGRDASQVQQWGVCMLDAWAWDDKDQQTMQPATKLHRCSSAYLEEARESYIAFVSEVLSQRLTTKGVRMMRKKERKMLDLSGCDAAALMEAGGFPRRSCQGHTGEISLYSVLSLA